MATSVLVTKLFIPPTRAELVHRPDLIERLNDGLDRKLTLLSAPAGFGKTTLVSHWVENLRNNHKINEHPIKVAWLTLNQGDNDPVRFLIYLITALNQIKDIETNLGQGALSMLKSPQPPSTNTVLISLINDLAATNTKIIFILDDYHLIEAEPIHQALVFLLENVPPQLHLVIATRQDPPLYLGRLRARDQLTEIRATDLRFNSSEAADFLNRVMDLDLSPLDITELESRTEGWIAGLQLAAISIQGRKDKTDFIKSFTGSHRLVLDFLIEEVLVQQAESIQNFLLHTSILDRMTGSLCDALIREENSQEILENLDRANLFIIPLDEERLWYRYHQLFADLLRQRMHQTRAEEVKKLHHKASEWYETNGYIDEAIEHSFLAEDYVRAAKQIEATAETMWGSGYDKLRHWLFLLPDELICFKPKLCIYKAWYLLSSGQLDAADQVLDDVGPILEDSGDGTTTQEQEYSSDDKNLRGMLAATRAFAAFYRVEIENLIMYANQALEYLPLENITWRITAYNALGDGYDFKGEIQKSFRSRLAALEMTRIAGSIYPAMIASAKLAINLRLQGQLQEVKEVCKQIVKNPISEHLAAPEEP
ncbi:MAG: hypothetical protein ACK2UW_03515, partial [Anaerolineales bacterium]